MSLYTVRIFITRYNVCLVEVYRGIARLPLRRLRYKFHPNFGVFPLDQIADCGNQQQYYSRSVCALRWQREVPSVRQGPIFQEGPSHLSPKKIFDSARKNCHADLQNYFA